MRGYSFLVLASVAAIAIAASAQANNNNNHIRYYKRQSNVSVPDSQQQGQSLSPDTSDNGNAVQNTAQDNPLASPTTINNDTLNQQQQQQTDSPDQTADASGSQTQSVPSTLFDNLPSFLGVTLPGQSQTAAPTNDASGSLSFEPDDTSESIDTDSSLGSSTAAVQNRINAAMVALLLSLVTVALS